MIARVVHIAACAFFLIMTATGGSARELPAGLEDIPVLSQNVEVSDTGEATPLSGADSLLSDSLQYVDSTQPEIRVGLHAGLGRSSGDLQNVALEPSARTDAHGGIRIEFEFAHPLYFRAEFELASRGMTGMEEVTRDVSLQRTFQFDYLDVPLLFLARVPVAIPGEIVIGGGAVPGFLLSSTDRSQLLDQDTTLVIEDGLEQFDFRLEVRGGIEYPIAPKLHVTAEIRYLHGLQNILILDPRERDDRVWRSRDLFLTLGIMFRVQRPIR